jgi:hypothetical protein
MAGRRWLTPRGVLLLVLAIAAAVLWSVAPTSPATGATGTPGASGRTEASPPPSSSSALTVSGTIKGGGGSGPKAWSIPLAGARIGNRQLDVWTRTDAQGHYSLRLPANADIASVVLSVSHTHYQPRQLPALGSDSVRNASLRVRPTTVVLLIRSRGSVVGSSRIHLFAHHRVADAQGRAVFAALTLRPHWRYRGTVLTHGYTPAAFRLTSRPGHTVLLIVGISPK